MSLSNQEKARRATEAERLLNEPLLKEAFDEIERDAIETMLGVDDVVSPDANRIRQLHCLRANAIRALRFELQKMIAEGKRVATRIERVV